MATVRILNPSSATSVSTNLYECGDPGPYTVGSFVVTVASASSLSMTFRAAPIGTAVTTTSPQLGYVDLSGDGTQTAGSTAITANGQYRVACDALCLGIHVTAGTASVTAAPLAG